MIETFPVGIIVAAIGGLAIGIERQWSGHATGPAARFAGVRTFTLIGASGGISGWLWITGFGALALVPAAVAGAIIVIAYAAASGRDVDGTTEMGAAVVLGAGIVSGVGYTQIASAVIATTALLLIEKSRLHAGVRRLNDVELRAAARFAIMAVVVLPLLPEGPFGPGPGIRPRELWILVLFFSALSFLGYVARRATGSRYGYPLAGLLGGIVSSTSVTLSYSRASRSGTQSAKALAYGVVAASTILYVRVAIATAALNQALLLPLAVFLVPPFVVGVLTLLIGIREMHAEPESKSVEALRNPLQILQALQMAVIFQVVLFGVHYMRQFGGDSGLIASGAVLGLTDLDALTLSMARAATSGVPPEQAAQAIAAGLVSNTLLKSVIALTIGAPGFRGVVALSFGAMIVAIAVFWLW